jgi:hypothetical protein
VYGDAWVYGDAQVYGNAWVSGDAQVYGNAWVSGDAQVYGNAWVSGDAQVYGNAWVSGDAWVSGNAQVYGDAWVYGDASKTPICVSGLRWAVTITDSHMRIGCQFHPLTAWCDFDDKTIAAMDGREALRFWRQHKALLLGLAATGGRLETTGVAR